MSVYRILYGTTECYLDVTSDVMRKCVGINSQGHMIATIPAGDLKRASLFSDPARGHLKHVEIYRDYEHWRTLEHDQTMDIPLFHHLPRSMSHAADLLYSIHTCLDFRYGSLTDEYPEQMMIARFLNRDAKVLELGTNTGRTSMVISSILNDDKQFVTMETHHDWCQLAEFHKQLNNRQFTIVDGTISSVPLYQKGMCCVKEPDGVPVHVFSLEEFRSKFPIAFDTLVADCEGALLPILTDYPSLLDGIQTIIMENDYRSRREKKQLNSILEQHEFHCVYREILVGDDHPCHDCFYEVWQRFPL